MPRPPSWSLRSHLLLLVGLVVLPSLVALFLAGSGRFDLAQRLLSLVLAATLSLALGWSFGHRVLVGPIRALADHLARVERGELGRPTGLAEDPTEIGRLARAFEAMEAALLVRERERQAAEDALRASEEHYRIIFDAAPIGIFFFDTRSVILEANQAFRDLLGAGPEALRDFCMFERLHQPEVLRAVREALQGRPGEAEGEYVSITARHRTLARLLTYPIRSGDGRVLGGIGLAEDITERARTQAALREAEQTTRSILDSVNDAIIVHDMATGAILEANMRAAEMFGCSRLDLLRRPVGDLSEGLPPHGQAEALAWMQKAAAGTPQVFEWRARHSSGRCFWVEVNMRRAQIGGADRILVAVRDIEARKAASAALRDAEARYQELFENLPDSIFWIGVREDGALLLESMNPAQEAVVGRASREVAGLPLGAWLPPELAAQLEANYRRCLEAGRPISYEEGADLGSGPRHLQTLLVPIRNAEGRFHRIVGISTDITERRRIEEESRERERLFRLLFERSGDANLLIDDNRFVDCNQATVDILGAPDRARVLGTHPSELSPPFQPDGRSSREKADEMIATAHARGSHHFEWMHRKLDGTDLPVEVLLTAIPWKGKQLLHTTWRDRTEARRAEEERRRMEGQLQQAQKLESLGVLAGGIAHDFNNLLTAVLGNLNLAQFNLNPESPAAPFLENAERTVLRASDLTKQMLAYAGKGRFVVALHDLNAVVSEMTHLLRVSVSKQAFLRLDLAEGLPPLEADGAQLQQVVMNLVTNASDALGESGGTITLTTGMATLDAATLASAFPGQPLSPGPYLTLEVSDTGQGMTPEVMARIFDPFFTTKATGRGLGLSAMLGILRGHKAGLKVYSEVGRGSSFRVFFPAAPGDLPARQEAGADPEVPLTGTVLLVDDEPSLLATLAPALEAVGLRVITAQDGRDALERFQADPDAVDLVLMDLTMPRMDGKDAFLAMRRIRPDLRVILSSGYNEQESVQAFLGRGLAGFLQKPYTLDALRAALKQALAR